jgi:hypothetical protein
MKGMAIVVSAVLLLAVTVQAEVMFQDSFEDYPEWEYNCPPNWDGYNNEYPDLLMGIWPDAAEARTGEKSYVFAGYSDVPRGMSEILISTVPVRPEDAEYGIVTGSSWVKVGSQDPDGETDVSSLCGILIRDSSGIVGTNMVVGCDTGNTNKRVRYFDGGTLKTVPVEWPTDEYFKVTEFVNEFDQTWGFSLKTEAGTNLVSVSDIAFSPSIYGPFNGMAYTIDLYAENSVNGDGFFLRYDDVTFEFSTGEPLPGDANNDGVVNVGDLGILAGNYGTLTGATWEMGDFNGDGAVNVGDLGILAGNYGSSAAASVPEPLSLSLLTVGGLALLRRKR